MVAYSSKIEGVRAAGRRIDMSPKDAMEICRHIKGMRATKADAFLGKVQVKEEFVPYPKYNKQLPHRTGGKPGRFPVKAARIIQKILRNAINNAEQKGLDKDKLVIRHAAANLGPSYARKKSKGRWTYHQIDTVHVELILNA